MFLIYTMVFAAGFFGFLGAADHASFSAESRGGAITQIEAAQLMLELAPPVGEDGDEEWAKDWRAINELLPELHHLKTLQDVFALLSPYIVFFWKNKGPSIPRSLKSRLSLLNDVDSLCAFKGLINSELAKDGGFASKGMVGMFVAFGLMGLKAPHLRVECKSFLQEKLLALKEATKLLQVADPSSYGGRVAEFAFRAVLQMIEILEGRVPQPSRKRNKVARAALNGPSSQRRRSGAVRGKSAGSAVL